MSESSDASFFQQISVSKEGQGQRLDVFLSEKLPDLSRSKIQNMIKSGDILLNNAPSRPKQELKFGDEVQVGSPPPPAPVQAEAEALNLDILFEDEVLMVIHKPAGMVVHPGAGNDSGTVVNALLHHCEDLDPAESDRPGIVHRLDKETSGCLLVAKNARIQEKLSMAFADRTVKKIYLAWTLGHLSPSSGKICTQIQRHPVHRTRMAVVPPPQGRYAETDFRVIFTTPQLSLVECRLHTGRTHQIRVHMKHLGHPIIGDKVYGSRKAPSADRQLLHAWKLGFFHPESKIWMEFSAPLPDDFLIEGFSADTLASLPSLTK